MSLYCISAVHLLTQNKRYSKNYKTLPKLNISNSRITHTNDYIFVFVENNRVWGANIVLREARYYLCRFMK